jgi:hypothetical protein
VVTGGCWVLGDDVCRDPRNPTSNGLQSIVLMSLADSTYQNRKKISAVLKNHLPILPNLSKKPQKKLFFSDFSIIFRKLTTKNTLFPPFFVYFFSQKKYATT